MFTNAKSILLHRCVNTSTQPRCYFLVLLAWYGACWRTLGLGASILFAHVHQQWDMSTQPRCYFLVLLAWYGACWRTLGLGASILFAHVHQQWDTSTQPRCYFLVLLAWYGACWRTLGLSVSILFAHVHCIDIRELRYTLMYEKLWHLQHATLPLGSSMYYIGLCGTKSEPPPPPPPRMHFFA